MVESLMKTREQVNDQGITLDASVLVSGHVKIINGDTVIDGKNKITSRLLRDLANFIGGHTFPDNQGTLNRYYNNPAGNWVYLGTDLTTPTNASTDALISPIGPTKCQTISSTAWQTGNAFYVQWMATFNPGTVSGIVGEMGLYLYCGGASLNSFMSTYNLNGSALVARYAVADGEFTQFTIDTTKPVIIVWAFKFETDYKILNQGIINIADHVACYDDTSNFNCPCVNWTSHSSASYSCMVLGSDTTTHNTPNMTALVTPIGSGIGTVPNTQSGSLIETEVGDYKLNLTAVWNAGTVSGTVGEIGLYLYSDPTWRGLGTMTPSGARMWARLSNADGHFSSFAINTGKNLTITWQWRFKFN